MPEYQDLGQNNRTSPFLAGEAISRLTLNAECLQIGRTRKRRGITTDVSAQVGLTIGTTAPFRYFRWYYPKGDSNCLVAVGSDAIAIPHPYNRFLYTRTAAGTDTIYESPTSTVATSWGLTAPSGIVSDTTALPSSLYSGAYLYAVTEFDLDRLVESPPFFVPSLTAAGLTPLLQWVFGPAYSAMFYTNTLPSGRIAYRIYRKLFHQATSGGNWYPYPTGPWGLSGMQLVAEIRPGEAPATPTCTGTGWDGLNSTVTAASGFFTSSMIGKNIVIADTGTFAVALCISSTEILVVGNATCTDKTFTVSDYGAYLLYRDQAMTPEGRLQKFDQAVVPFAHSAVYQHGLWVYGNVVDNRYAYGTCTGVYGAPSTTITATASIFTAAMVGKTISIAGVGQFAIATHISGTQITVAGDATCAGVAFAVLERRPYMFAWSSRQCPETYAGPLLVSGSFFQASLASTQEGLLQGEASGLIPPDMGEFVGWAAMGYRLLALCENGYYSLDRQPDGVRYAVSQSPGPIDCASRATICSTPWGEAWLSRKGVALWDGSGAPIVLTQEVLDPGGSDIDFAADLSGAMAAYHERRNQYVIVIPTSAGGQTILMVQLDMLAHKKVWVSKWTTPIVAAVTGLGYDAELEEIVWRFGAAAAILQQADGVYADSSAAYACGADLWKVAQPSRVEPMSDVQENLTVFVIPNREVVTGSQTVEVDIRGMAGLDAADGIAVTESLVWPANNRKGKITKAARVSGKAVRVQLRNTDTDPFEFVAVRIDQAWEAPTKYDE